MVEFGLYNESINHPNYNEARRQWDLAHHYQESAEDLPFWPDKWEFYNRCIKHAEKAMNLWPDYYPRIQDAKLDEWLKDLKSKYPEQLEKWAHKAYPLDE